MIFERKTENSFIYFSSFWSASFQVARVFLLLLFCLKIEFQSWFSPNSTSISFQRCLSSFQTSKWHAPPSFSLPIRLPNLPNIANFPPLLLLLLRTAKFGTLSFFERNFFQFGRRSWQAFFETLQLSLEFWSLSLRFEMSRLNWLFGTLEIGL